MGLSDLFSKIQATKSASVQSGRGGGGGRAGGVMRVTNPKPVKAVRVEAKPQRNSTTPKSKGRKEIANKGGRGGGKGGKAGGGRGGGKREASKPVNAEDLDKEMDSYWIKGGKAENIISALDKEMDDYQKAGKSAKPASSSS